jgi:hypothetical protein
MKRKGNEMNQKEMYGCTEAQIDRNIDRASNLSMFVAGLLSDAQFALEMDDPECARQIMNRAKYALFEYTDTRSFTNHKKIVD